VFSVYCLVKPQEEVTAEAAVSFDESETTVLIGVKGINVELISINGHIYRRADTILFQ
jgi:hypothetical protein